MPHPDSSLHRHSYAEAAHGKRDQSDTDSQITREIERKKGDVEIQEISYPDGKGLNRKLYFMLHSPKTPDAFPYVFKHFRRFTNDRQMLHLYKNEPNTASKHRQSDIRPRQVDQPIKRSNHCRWIFGKEMTKKADIEDT